MSKKELRGIGHDWLVDKLNSIAEKIERLAKRIKRATRKGDGNE